jgi:predicted RNase H-like nuclease (RuvC/YqgF family)
LIEQRNENQRLERELENKREEISKLIRNQETMEERMEFEKNTFKEVEQKLRVLEADNKRLLREIDEWRRS